MWRTPRQWKCYVQRRTESHPVMDTLVISQPRENEAVSSYLGGGWSISVCKNCSIKCIFEFSWNLKESFLSMIYDLMSLDGGQFSVYCIVAWCTGPCCSIILFIHWVIVSLGPIQSRPPTSLTLTVIHSCYLFMFFLKRWDSEEML